MNNELDVNNKVFIQGEVVSDPVYDHSVLGEDFYKFSLQIPRLSGQNDILPVTISKKMLVMSGLAFGMRVAIKGQFRSYNKLEDEKVD